MNEWIGVEPRELCRRHLLGVHGELHKFLPSWAKQSAIGGRIADNQMECPTYAARHDEVAAEMRQRGFKHASPLAQPDFQYLATEHRDFRVSDTGKQANRRKLAARCPECAERMKGKI